MPLVELRQVSKSFRADGRATSVLDGASLELARGETTSLTGVSGSGKSTLISVLAGLLVPDSGQVLFDGEDTARLGDFARARLRANRIGVVLQRDNLIPFLTARENVELALELAGRARGAARAEELLSDFGLADRLDHLPSRLSGGESQRVSLALALANEPDLLLADEVTGELDSASAARVMEIVFEASCRRGLTVLYVTHSGDLAARARRRLRLDAGRVSGA